MSDNGYLAPDGKLIGCEPWEHLEKARDIVEELTGQDLYGLRAEDYLLNLGYVVVRTRDVYAGLGWKSDDTFLHLTAEQRKWFEDNYDSFMREKQKAVDELMDFYDKE